MKPYRLHIFICQGKRCGARGSEDVLEEFKALVKAEGLAGILVSKSGCLKVCKETESEGEYCPAVVIYPDGVWYRKVSKADVAGIVEGHVKKGRSWRGYSIISSRDNFGDF